MKRIHLWTMLGGLGIGLTASLVGQRVWSQPDENRGAFPLPVVNSWPGVGSTSPKPADVAPTPGVPAPTLPPPVAEGSGNKGVVVPQESPPPLLAPGAVPTKLLKEAVAVAAVAAGADELRAELRLGRQQPAVSLEWVGPKTVRIRQPMAYQLLVRNASPSPVHNVVVRQKLPPGVVCKSSEPQAHGEAGELVWNLGTMPPEQSRKIELILVAEQRGTVNCNAIVTFTGLASHQIQVREPLLAVKMKAPDKIVIGDSVTILVGVSNPGDGAAEGVKVKVLLPEGLEHPAGRAVEAQVKEIPPREVRTMQLVCLARGTGAQKVTVLTSADGGITANDAVQMDILQPKLDVALSGPKLRYLDRHAVYVAKVVNPGSAPAKSVEVSQVVPAGFKFHQAGQGGQYQAATRTVSWSVGDLQPGQSKDVVVEMIPIEVGDHRLAVLAKSGSSLKSESETHTRVEGLSSLLIELADLDDPIEVGAETGYQLRVSNTGTKTETNVEVVCTLPEQVEFRGANCSAGVKHRLEGRDVIFEPLPRLAAKADVIYRMQVRGAAPGDVRFRTRVRADDLREPIVREERTRIYSDGTPPRPAGGLTPTAPAPAPMALPAQTPAGIVPASATPIAPQSAPLPPLPTLLPGTAPLPPSGLPPLPAPKN